MLKISDLWNVAFLVSKGAEINNLLVADFYNKKSVYFIFDNPNAEKLNQDFISGRATANVVQLKNTMNHLKDLLFNKMREVKENENHNTGNYKQSIRKRHSCNY